MNKLFIALIIAAIIAMIGFLINGIVSATTQESKSNHRISQVDSTNSDKQNIRAIWLETNNLLRVSSSIGLYLSSASQNE
jgi:uncharacterized alpha/beta hydrolase family protein